MTDRVDEQRRYHSFDALRATMMLLGVALHACQFYMTASLTPGFDFQDRRTSAACDFALLGIHSFRMQVFFVMAGFFGALLVARRGPGGMFRNRFRRVFLPMVVGWVVLYPVTISAFLYGCASHAGVPPGEAVLAWWLTGRIVWIEEWKAWYSVFLVGPLHLWFLYVLVWFYLGSFPVRAVGRLRGGAIGDGMNRLFRGLASTGLLLPAAVAVSFLTLLITPVGMFSQEFPAFIPNPLALIGFGPFFWFGWLLHGNPDLLDRFRRFPAPKLLVAAGLFVVYMGQLENVFDPSGAGNAKLAVAATGAAIAWLCVFGFIGLFQNHFERPSPSFRYVSDAAYWVYLAHLPLVYWLQVLMYDLPVAGHFKALIVLAVVTFALFLSYDLAVRSTFVGAFLNGRRHPRALFASTAAGGPEDGPATTS